MTDLPATPATPDLERPVLFLLHGLGCSARTWDAVVALLADDYECVAIDLPGHGAAAASPALTVEQVLDVVTARIVQRRARRWALVGHSMGGKIAMLVTARFEQGVLDVAAPLALVLVASSPPSPEPMDDDTREQMISWAAHTSISAADARTFVEANIAGPLPPAVLRAAVEDVQRVDRVAWLAWLERGSLEDWDDVGRLHTPTLVVAGADDGDLGVDAQRSLTLPHTPASEVTVVPDAAHLIMLEQPARLAELVGSFVAGVRGRLDELPPEFARLLLSDRVSARTRHVLLARLEPPPQDRTGVLDAAQRAVLDSLVRSVVPQRGTSVDLTARLVANLAARTSDGWRFAELPDDIEAWRRGLDTLAALADGFVSESAETRAGWIQRMIDGSAGSAQPGHLSGEQMTLWFEDVRAEAVRGWVSHPGVLARLGYDGFANGGDGPRKQGYLRVSAGEREHWQLAPAGTDVRRPAP